MSSFRYGLMSDLHAHAWSSFSTLDKEGRNTRLMSIIAEIDRCCQEVLALGGYTVIIAGDIFHVRGKIEPSVFNPMQDCFDKWIQEGIRFWAIPGNHDLETENSTKLGSAVEMLRRPGFAVVNNPVHYKMIGLDGSLFDVLFMPYIKGTKNFFSTLDMMVDGIREGNYKLEEMELICHLGIDGTLDSIPAHGASAARLADYGFKRVWSGDYHHMKEFGQSVFSIGATTHQTWRDAGSIAGFWLVHDKHAVFRASHAPRFIALDGTEDPDDLPFIVDGHYVHAKIGAASAKEVQGWRETLTNMGAKGVVIQAVPETAAVKRAGVTSKSMATLAQSLVDYCKEKSYSTEVAKESTDVLEAVS